METLKEIKIREITPSDAVGYLGLVIQLDEETKFMMYEPGERKTSVKDQEKHIREILASGNQTIFLAETNSKPIGFLGVVNMNVRRKRHCLYIVVGVLRKYFHQGIGTALFKAAEDWARTKGFCRLELTVIQHNISALGLYQKMGFEIEGTKNASLLIDGELVDEYYMAKIL